MKIQEFFHPKSTYFHYAPLSDTEFSIATENHSFARTFCQFLWPTSLIAKNILDSGLILNCDEKYPPDRAMGLPFFICRACKIGSKYYDRIKDNKNYISQNTEMRLSLFSDPNTG